MRALVCLSGLEGARFVASALTRLPLDRLDLYLLYVIDTRPAEELGYVRRLPFLTAHTATDAHREAAERAIAAEVLAEGQAAAVADGVPAERVHTLVSRGRPEREIVRLAGALDMDVIVVGARHRADISLGPDSVGPVARYVLDHAPCDVLLRRRGDDADSAGQSG